MSSTGPGDDLTPAEIENLNRLEAIARDGLQTFEQVGNALAEIRDRRLYRDSHGTFETYVRERWRVNLTQGDQPPQTLIPADTGTTSTANREVLPAPPSKQCEALAKACEQTLSALGGDDRVDIEIRVAVREPGDPGAPADEKGPDPSKVTQAIDDELLPTLRWLLSQATGTIGKVAHQLERRAADIDDDARERLRDDLLVLDDELATVKALLIQLIDWDSELERLLDGELPPFDADGDPDDDE